MAPHWAGPMARRPARDAVEWRTERRPGVGSVAVSAGAVWEVHRAKMAAEEQEALREFMAVTGTEEERARFVLETAGWDLQVAPRGGPLRAGWGMRSAASALRPKGTVIRAGLGPAWPRPHGVWGRLPRVSGLAWKFMDAGGPGLLFRASVFRRARSVSETLGAAAVCVESPPGDVAAAASACGWPGGVPCFQMEPHQGRGGLPIPLLQGCCAGGGNPARHQPTPHSCLIAGRNYLWDCGARLGSLHIS